MTRVRCVTRLRRVTLLRSGSSAALFALGAWCVTACDGLTSVANPEVPLWVNHPGDAMSITQTRRLTADVRKVGEAYERGKPEIDAAHNRVFVGSSDHGLYALNAVDLSTLWRFETGGAVQSAPLYVTAEDAVYFGSNDGAVYKLRAADGKMLWRFSSNAEITRRPLLRGDTLFVVNANDTLIAIHPDTGKMRWYRHRQPAAGMEISGYAGCAVHGERVYSAFSDGVVMAYRVSDGAEAWPGPVDLAADAEQARGGEELRYLDVDTTPIVSKVGGTDAIFVASYEGGVYALDALSGGRLWANDAVIGANELTLFEAPMKPRRADETSPPPAPSSSAKPAADKPVAPEKMHRVLVAASGLTGLWGLSVDDGAELWRRDLPTGGVTAAEPWSGALLIGTTRYGIFLVHPLDGGVIDGLHSGGAFAATPSAYGRRAFMLSNDGVLFSLTVVPPT